MNETLLQPLRAQINAAGLQRYETALLDAARVAVDIELDGAAENIVGESRFGGAPDVPEDWSWPADENGEKMAFLLQINLTDVPNFAENPLPARGLLAFFLGLDEPASNITNRIFWFDDTALQTADAPDEDEFADDAYLDLPPQRLKFSLRADVPHWASDDWELLAQEMEDNQQDAFGDLTCVSQNVIGQLLGHVSGIGHDPRGDALIVRELNPSWLYNYKKRLELDFSAQTNWYNLLRLESIMELDFIIWDAGFLNFLIHRDDLEKHDFARVYAAVESS